MLYGYTPFSDKKNEDDNETAILTEISDRDDDSDNSNSNSSNDHDTNNTNNN